MKKDLTPWLLLPGIVLTLSGVTLLAPHQAAQAAPPTPQTPKVFAYDDGDGDELLEHWDNPLYYARSPLANVRHRRRIPRAGRGCLPPPAPPEATWRDRTSACRGRLPET